MCGKESKIDISHQEYFEVMIQYHFDVVPSIFEIPVAFIFLRLQWRWSQHVPQKHWQLPQKWQYGITM